MAARENAARRGMVRRYKKRRVLFQCVSDHLLENKTMNSRDIDSLCVSAFMAYNERAGGKTWDGKPIPPWEECGPRVRNNWRAAIVATINRLDGEELAIDYDGPQPVFEAVL